jgi:energy-coupling factor transporter ATP-binding protein EcfA2
VALIGRQSELAALTAELDALRLGHGRSLVLLGESGSGKTALAQAFAGEARNASMRVLWMAGRAIRDGARCWPWPAIVRELGGDQELVELLSTGGGGARMFEDVAAVLASEAERQPVVLVIDDGDVVDDVAVDLLVFVAEQLRFRSLFVLVTARDRRRVETLCRAATLIVLQGLGPASVREMLRAHGVVIDDEIASAVVRLTGGLPGELIVLARELSSGRVDGVDDVIGVALGLASEVSRTEGRAATEPLVRRLIAARDLATPRTRGEVALFVHRLGGTTSTSADDRVTAIEETLNALANDETAIALRAQLHAALARELYHGDVLRDGRDPRAEAATGWALAQQSNDAPTLASCLRARHDIEWRPGTGAQRLALVDEMVGLLDGTSQHEAMADALLARFAVYLELGDPRADREFDRFLRVADRDPTPRLRHLVLSRRAMRALMAGDLARAEELIEAAAASARRSGEPDGAVVALNQRFELQAERADRSPLLPLLERFRAVSSHPAIAASLALARLDAHDLDGARSAVAQYEDVSLDGLQPEYGRAWVLSMLGEAFVALGALDAIRRTAAALLPFAGTNIVAGGAVLYRGAVDHHLGVLLVATGDRDAGIAHLRAARQMHHRLGAARWADRSATALASVDPRPADGSMVRDGDVWTLSFATTTIRAKDSKGLRDLAMLLPNPGVEIRATVLAGTVHSDTSADVVLDKRARDEVAARLRTLESDLAQADVRGDQAASARAAAERDALVHELRVATGLAGRSRRLSDPTERARKAVSARLHDAIARIERQHPELGLHLRESVVTGRSCCYQPKAAVHWIVRQNGSGS